MGPLDSAAMCRSVATVAALLVGAYSPASHANVPTCPSAPTSAAQLVPADADFVVQLRPADFSTTPTGAGLRRLAALDLQLGDWLALYDTCLTSATSVSVSANEKGDALWLVRGSGVGAPEALACVADWHARRNRGVQPFAATPTERAGGCVLVRSHTDGATTLTLGRDVLVMASAPWAAVAKSALSQDQARGLATDLAEAQALIAGDAANALFGTLHRPDTLLDPGPWEPSVRNFAISLEIDPRGELSTLVRLQTRDFGESAVAAVRDALVQWPARAKALGLPSGLLGGLSLETRGALVDLRWRATAQQLKQVGESLAHGGRGGSLF